MDYVLSLEMKVLSLTGVVRNLRPYRVPAHAAHEAA